MNNSHTPLSHTALQLGWPGWSGRGAVLFFRCAKLRLFPLYYKQNLRETTELRWFSTFFLFYIPFCHAYTSDKAYRLCSQRFTRAITHGRILSSRLFIQWRQSSETAHGTGWRREERPFGIGFKEIWKNNYFWANIAFCCLHLAKRVQTRYPAPYRIRRAFHYFLRSGNSNRRTRKKHYCTKIKGHCNQTYRTCHAPQYINIVWSIMLSCPWTVWNTGLSRLRDVLLASVHL